MKLVAAAFTALIAAALPASASPQTPALAQSSADAAEPARRVAATLALASQEYRLAWQRGRMTAPSEWEEAKLFVAEARHSARALPPALAHEMDARLAALEARLAAQLPADSLAAESRAIEVRLSSALGVTLDDRPAREPSIANGEALFRSTCTRCHGMQGRGDGPVAHELNPPPADLADAEALRGTTPLDLYRKVTFGVPGTKMQAFGEALSREERWDLVAYVATLTDPLARGGRTGQLAVVFGTVRGTLGGAMDLAARGDREAAARAVLDAYMAFEAVEGELAATEPHLVTRAEERFTSLRLAAAGTQDHLAEQHARLLETLRDAEAALTRGHSAAGLFAESLLLILREGLEAILVIGAIMAVLLRADAKERQRDVRWGIALAILASLATAGVLEWIFLVTPAQREALEGGVMLVAAAVLFYVSYWLISKVETVAWTRFVKGQIQRAVESGSGLALGGVAFLAVYREGFETVLFYKALFVTGGSAGAGAITAGLLTGFGVLVAVFVGIERFGLRLPLRPFFAVTGATLAYMAFVFAGTAIKELQEGDYLPSTLIPGAPRNDFFGIYPTWESLGLQLVILVALAGALLWTFVVKPRRTREGSGMAAQTHSGTGQHGAAVPPSRRAASVVEV